MDRKLLAHALDKTHGHMGLDLSYGLYDGDDGYIESAVHELAHAVVLKIPLDTKERYDRPGYWRAGISAVVGMAIDNMSCRVAKDWQELLAVAAELLVLRRLAFDVDYAFHADDTLSKLDALYPIDDAEKRRRVFLGALQYHMKTKATLKRAKTVFQFLESIVQNV